MINVIRHEIIKDGAGNPISVVVGVTYTDDVTKRQSYKDTVFSASDFSTTLPEAEVLAKVKEWLTKIPEFEYRIPPGGTVQVIKGKSILQHMKEETQKVETIVSMEKGQPGSLIDEIIPEA